MLRLGDACTTEHQGKHVIEILYEIRFLFSRKYRRGVVCKMAAILSRLNVL